MKKSKTASKQKILKKILKIVFWLKILGILYIVLTPLIAFLFYSKASARGLSKTSLVTASIVLGLILGCIFFKFAFKLKKTTTSNHYYANKLLLCSAIYIIFVVIFGLVAGGIRGITGLLDLITFVQIILVRAEIKIL